MPARQDEIEGLLTRIARMRAEIEWQVPPRLRPLVRAAFADPPIDARRCRGGTLVCVGTASYGPFSSPDDALAFVDVAVDHGRDHAVLATVADLLVRRRRALDEARRQERRAANGGSPHVRGVATARRDGALAYAERLRGALHDLLSSSPRRAAPLP